jgi:hypothetical protein
MDEGLTLKMCTSILYATIAEATDLYKMNTTSVSHTYLLLCVINVCLYVPFNVAFNVTFNVVFNVYFNVAFNVSFNVAFNVSCNVAFNVSFNVTFKFALMFLLLFLVMFLLIGHVMNHFKFHCLCNIMWFTLSLLMTKVCREVDAFFLDLASIMPSNKNVELGGRDGFKFFKHGVTSYMLPKVRRINGGWWISIARQLKLFFCVTTIVSDTTRTKFCDALSLLFEVHHGLRNPLHKDDLDSYQGKINSLLTTLVDIGLPSSKSQCNSIKYHWPRHWGQTRQVRSCMVPCSFNVHHCVF